MRIILERNAKQFVLPVMAVVSAIVSAAATEGAFHYRLSDAHTAAAFDIFSHAGMAVLFVMIAKINLARTPQHQNLALFAAGGAGLMVMAAIDNIISLFAK